MTMPYLFSATAVGLIVLTIVLLVKVEDNLSTITRKNENKPRLTLLDNVLFIFLLAALYFIYRFATKNRSIFPKSITAHGTEIDNLFWLIFFFVAIALVVSVILMIYPIITQTEEKRKKAKYFTGTKWSELKWIIIPVSLLALSDFYILFVEHKTWVNFAQAAPQADVHIGVIGRQWNWIFVYPGPDNKLNTSDDVRVDEQNSELHIPLQKNVIFDLQAADVLHSFCIPNARFKQDVIPGRTIKRWTNITEPGKYEIQCTQICGLLHAKMRNFLTVESREDYQKFITALYEKNKEKLFTQK